jgi:hypothetical protein
MSGFSFAEPVKQIRQAAIYISLMLKLAIFVGGS